MKKIVPLILLSLFALSARAQNIVEHIGINKTRIDVSSTTILGSITINPTEEGKVLVRFDGACTSTPGDRIVLAASNTNSWTANQGNVNVEAVDADVNTSPFSHTRVYEVAAGSHTFNAIADNLVETAGDGIASIYGSLTVKFVPTSTTLLEQVDIVKTNINLSNSTVVGSIDLNPPSPGKVIVRFDGNCISSVGDRIVLAASNTLSFPPNDGNVGVEAVDADVNRNSFSHTRVYEVDAGPQTFNAIAFNFVETDGTGIASIYGSLTAEFIPISNAIVEYQRISKTSIDLSNQTVLATATINPQEAGTAIVRFDGSCISSVGDLIVLAASDNDSWSVNDGNLSLEAANSDVNQNSFSHTRAYSITAGSHSFNAIAHNFVETDGDGIASIYASLTVEFIPGITVGIKDWEDDKLLSFYPNPSTGLVKVDSPPNFFSQKQISLQVLDMRGQILQTISPEENVSEIQLGDYPSGLYFLQIQDKNKQTLSHRILEKQ